MEVKVKYTNENGSTVSTVRYVKLMRFSYFQKLLSPDSGLKEKIECVDDETDYIIYKIPMISLEGSKYAFDYIFDNDTIRIKDMIEKSHFKMSHVVDVLISCDKYFIDSAIDFGNTTTELIKVLKELFERGLDAFTMIARLNMVTELSDVIKESVFQDYLNYGLTEEGLKNFWTYLKIYFPKSNNKRLKSRFWLQFLFNKMLTVADTEELQKFIEKYYPFSETKRINKTYHNVLEYEALHKQVQSDILNYWFKIPTLGMNTFFYYINLKDSKSFEFIALVAYKYNIKDDPRLKAFLESTGILESNTKE